MDRTSILNKRLEKIIQNYPKVSAYQRSRYKGIKKAHSEKPPIRITPKDLVRCDRDGREITENNNKNRSPFGLLNGVVPQQFLDIRPSTRLALMSRTVAMM